MNSTLISANELSSKLDINTIILDCRYNLADKNQGLSQYLQGHILGAFYMDLEKDLSGSTERHGGRHPLPNMSKLEEKFRNAGINQHSLVVLYDDSRMAYAARAWWLLRHMGFNNVRILDGGFKAWLAINAAIDRREAKTKYGNFKANIKNNDTANRNDILHSSNVTLIDSREPRRFQGLEEPIDPIAGHIDRAVNYPWQEITNEHGFIKPIEWQKKHWQSLESQDNLVVYCGSGVTACVNILSLYMCNIEAKLYAGSWSDWCSYMALEKQVTLEIEKA